MKNLIGRHLVTQSCLEAPLAARAIGLWSPSAWSKTVSPTESRLQRLKREMLGAALEETADPGLIKSLCGGANQALAMAWETPQPLLVFPCLFEEMAAALRERHLRQSRPGATMADLLQLRVSAIAC